MTQFGTVFFLSKGTKQKQKHKLKYLRNQKRKKKKFRMTSKYVSQIQQHADFFVFVRLRQKQQ